MKGELETNEELQQLYPDILYATPHKDSPLWSVEKGIVVRRLANPREATVEAHGVVETQPVGSHFRLMIFDDLVTPASASTPDQVKKTTIMHALADNLGARGPDGLKRKWHIGTRYHFGDTYQNLLDRKSLKPRIYPATDDGTRDGNPVLLTPEAWEITKRDQPTNVLAAQMLQNPAAGNEAMFKKEWLKFADIRPATLTVAIMCDPASSRKKSSDDTVIHVWGMDTARNRYLLDGYHHKMGLTERWTHIRDLRKKWTDTPGIQLIKVGYERYGSPRGRVDAEGLSLLAHRLLVLGLSLRDHSQVDLAVPEVRFEPSGVVAQLTMKEAAEAMNVSVRSVVRARKREARATSTLLRSIDADCRVFRGAANASSMASTNMAEGDERQPFLKPAEGLSATVRAENASLCLLPPIQPPAYSLES
jgi:hypothetical protein